MPHAVRKSRRRSASDAGKRRPCRSPAAHDLGRSTRLGFETKGSVSQVVLGRSLGPGPAFSRCFAAMNASISSTGQRFDRGPRLTGCGISPSRCQRYKVASEICRISITSFRRRSRFSIVQIVIHQDCGLRITARREFVTWAHRPGLRLRDAGFLGSGFGPPQRAVGHAPVPSDRPHRFPTHARMPAPPASVRSRPCPTHAALCWSRVTLDSSFGEGAHRPPTASAAFFFGVGLALVDKREPDRASQRLRSGRTGRATMSDGSPLRRGQQVEGHPELRPQRPARTQQTGRPGPRPAATSCASGPWERTPSAPSAPGGSGRRRPSRRSPGPAAIRLNGVENSNLWRSRPRQVRRTGD